MILKHPAKITHSNAFLRGEEMEMEMVNEFKYLGVILGPSLPFKSLIEKISNTITFKLHNFRQIRSSLTVNVGRVFLPCYDFIPY